jgi:5-methylcytosine-specific restriction endonuclease McrA
MRHRLPDGDPAVIFERALTLLRAHLERQKCAAAAKSSHDERDEKRTTGSGRTRHVPAAVRRAVWARDAGRCAFVGTHGRCTERGFLELHHVEPFAAGGETTNGNLQLRCRAHNAYEATLYFGRRSHGRQRLRTITGLGPDLVRQILLACGHCLDDGLIRRSLFSHIGITALYAEADEELRRLEQHLRAHRRGHQPRPGSPPRRPRHWNAGRVRSDPGNGGIPVLERLSSRGRNPAAVDVVAVRRRGGRRHSGRL